jgi:hypothetical protein
MKLHCELEEALPVSTNSKQQEYIIRITGTGTINECNHVMDRLMQTVPDVKKN